MKPIKRTLAVIALAAASAAAWEGGTALVQNVQFARAEQKVESTREQLEKVEDLSTVFRNVGKVIEPSVVQIEVHKTIKGAHRGMPDQDFLKRFFKDHGMNDQADPNDPNGGDNGNNDTPDDGGDDLQEVGTGSGVIIEVDGSDAYIVTNNHVAGGATDMTITLADGRTIKNGKTLGADPKSDLAVVKISAEHLIAAKWGDSDELDRGDWVLAFGSPFGYVGSMTHGIVSALNRQANILGSTGYENFIQVDAPINPGNSGGPLVNIHGEVVGINTAIASKSGGFQGIGFAIPSDQAKPIYAMLKNKGKVTRGWLGVEIVDTDRLTPEMIKSLDFTGENGILVKSVLQGTPSSGRLQPGDVITGIDGKPVQNVQHLRNEVAMISPGTDTKLQVFRNHQQQDVTIKIGQQPDDPLALNSSGSNAVPNQEKDSAVESLGLKVTDVNDELAQKYGLGDAREGALVTNVEPRSVAYKNGLQNGDLITRVGGQTVANAKEASDALSKQDVNKGISLYITNKSGSSIVFLQNEK